jgi:hypothetical protein
MNAKKSHGGDTSFSRYIRYRLRQAFKGKPSRQLKLENIGGEEEDI